MDGQYTIELPQITAKTRISKFNYSLTSPFLPKPSQTLGTQHMVVRFIPESLRLKEEWIQLTDADGRQRFIKECKTRIQILKKVTMSYLPYSLETSRLSIHFRQQVDANDGLPL